MTINGHAAALTREAGSNLARALKAMPPERQSWSPMDEGRSAIDQVAECAVFNDFAAVTLREGIAPPLDVAEVARRKVQADTADEALRMLRTSTDALLRAIEEFPTERAGELVSLPLAPGLRKSFAWIMTMGYWNMIYHWGQINYIQTLYGDRGWH